MAPQATAAAQAIPRRRDRRPFEARPDDQLLREFLSRTDEDAQAAFATLIERHGPIVHRVCLDVLRDREEARDAAQAVFLVLARKAGSIRKPESLGPWLHGVAFRVARHARVDIARRRAAERRKAEIMQRDRDPGADIDPCDRAALHQEVDRLPDKYRQPIILCYMQGKTQAEAAEALGWPLGTVQIRLHRGRERLRSRLIRLAPGTLGLAGLGLAASPSVRAAMPGRQWAEATASAAVRFAGGMPTAGMVSPAVIRLAEATIAATLYGPLKVAALAVIALLLTSAALSWDGPKARGGHAGRIAEPEPATRGLIEPQPAPESFSRKASTTSIGAVKQPGPPARGRETTEVRARPSLEGRLTDGCDIAGASTSPGHSVASASLDRGPRRLPPAGRELFERVWVKDDPRARGGDGLGPVFNGSSCVACHNLGGPGGAGGSERNIEIATATGQSAEGTGFFYAFSMDLAAGRFDSRMGSVPGISSGIGSGLDPRSLAAIHPGFRDSLSVVLHQYGTDPAYNAWRGSVPGQHGAILVRTSERNPPALFGAGLIDAIPDAAIEAGARRRFAGSSSVKGRVSRLRDGRIGRFGWKAQTATLREFVLSAAAGEMGLEVPGRRQAADPRLPGLVATGLDMDEAECNALTDHVRGLPAPILLKPADERDSAQVRSGQGTFKAIGCAHCHVPKLGEVDGIYSDLLLHDMSPGLGDSDAYSVFAGGSPRAEVDGASGRPGAGTSTIQEWRTPPLWGLRDSAPYLHDGRAVSIEQAIAAHAGQAAPSARRFADLSPRRKRQLVAFLGSLAAPPANR